MNYFEALDWIHSKIKVGEKPGLKRMEWLLNAFDNPQRHLSAVHVVGTNGKGSTVSYLQHILSKSDYQVGTFTSPYIVEFRERISISGKMISESDLIALVGLVQPVVDSLPEKTGLAPASEFEVTTLMMFLYFTKMHPVDIAIIEAGIGGLFDATNMFHALAVVCPSIGLDHQDILGQSYAEIAYQKVSVLKHEEPFIFASQDDSVISVFEKVAGQKNCKTYQLNKDFHLIEHDSSFDFYYEKQQLSSFHLQLLGSHQGQNASLAIMTSLILQDNYPQVTLESIKEGLEEASWVGRTEFINPHLMIDGAHNNESIEALVELVKKDFSDKKVMFLFAAINSKPVDSMLEKLTSVGQVTVTSFPFPKALKLSDYPTGYSRVESFQEWFKQIKPSSESVFYIVTGSLYFISQVRQELIRNEERKK